MKNFNDSKFLDKIKKMYQEESVSNLKYLDPTKLFPENSILNHIKKQGEIDTLYVLEKIDKSDKAETSEKPINPFLEASMRAEALIEANASSEQDQSFNSNSNSNSPQQEPNSQHSQNSPPQSQIPNQNSQFVINTTTSSSSFNTTSTSATFKAEKKSSPNFAKTTEENLRKELESILLQVYLEHINKSKDFDIKVFENHVS